LNNPGQVLNDKSESEMTNYGHSESISESLTFKKQFELRDSGASPE